MMSEIDTKLNAAVIAGLVDVEAARKNSKLFDDLAVDCVDKICLAIGDRGRQQYRQFLEQLASDANYHGLNVNVVGIASDRIFLKVCLRYDGTRHTPKANVLLMRLVVVFPTCDVRLTYLGYNSGTVHMEHWRQSSKAVCARHGMTSWHSFDMSRVLWHEAEYFDFRLTWFTGWMKTGQQRLAKFEQCGRAIEKEHQINAIKTERAIAWLANVKDMIEQRVPGLRVSVERDDDSMFRLELYNVCFVSATKHVTKAVYLPASAYSSFEGTNKLLGGIGFRHRELVAQNPAAIPFYSLLRYCDLDKRLYCAHMKIYVNVLDEDQCDVSLPATAEIPEDSRLKRQMTLPLDKIGGYIASWLDYEKLRYEALMSFEARLSEIDKMAGLDVNY